MNTHPTTKAAPIHAPGCPGHLNYRDCTCGASSALLEAAGQPEPPACAHTPGPWRVGAMKNGDLPDGTLCVFSDHTQPGFSGKCVAAIAPPGKITPADEANAAVMASAPVLLSALQAMLDEIDSGCRMRSLPVLQARAAIDAATKGQP